MCTITATEFKRNFGKYMALGKKEQIIITEHGKECITIQPYSITRYENALKLIGVLPKNAEDRVDPEDE